MVDARWSMLDARYQTIRVPASQACSKGLGCEEWEGHSSRHGIDDISVRCSILRLYESCRTSSAFCVEFEFQKLLRYGPEVLGATARHGMAASTPQVLEERERTRWRTGLLGPFSKFNRGLALFCSSAAELGELQPEANPAIFLNLSDAHPIISCPMSISMSYDDPAFQLQFQFPIASKSGGARLSSPLLSSPILPSCPLNSQLARLCLESGLPVPRPQRLARSANHSSALT
jgi:hypothetical protein